MTKDLARELERLEQALKASDEIGAPEVFCTRETARAILAALKPEGEPVAWRAKLEGEPEWFLFEDDMTGEEGWHSVQPLYTRPAPAILSGEG